MRNPGRTCFFGVACAAILTCSVSLMADPIIISVSAPPELSTLIAFDRAVSTSWSETNAYTDVAIAALIDSANVGQTPIADAFLTTRIGPGTTTADEIAHTQFTVPAQLPICSSSSCGAMVTLFSGLNLGPGTYFLTMGPDTASVGNVGWFPALDPTVTKGSGVSQGNSFYTLTVAAYSPATPFDVYSHAMDFAVTGETVTTVVPEPVTAMLFGCGALFLFLMRGAMVRARQR